MSTIGLLLDPLDVLLFRDARPFESGDTARTGWPTPATFAGLIRTHLMQRAGIEPHKLHGLHEPPRELRSWFGRLQFRGPWLYVTETERVREWNAGEVRTCEVAPGPLVPCPADVVRLGKKATDRLRRLRPLDSPLPGWSPPCKDMWPMWLDQDADKVESPGGWIDRNALRKYLKGEELDSADVHPFEHFAVRENRTGIGIDPERLVADDDRRLIYSASFWRLAPGVYFYGEVEWPDSPDSPDAGDLFPPGLVLPWGGERRRVAVEQMKSPFPWSELEPQTNGNLLTLLVTPGVFSNATHPWKPREQGTLRAACVPKPLPVSGWDLAGSAENDHQGRPRPTRFAVPAGSVYFWTRSDRRADQPVTKGLKPIGDKPQNSDSGWGLALAGNWTRHSLNKE